MDGVNFDGERIESYFKGEFSEENATYIENIFCDDSKEDELNRLLHKQFYELLPEDELNKKDLDQILYRIHYEINTSLSEQKILVIDKITKWVLRIVAVIILPLTIIIGIHTYKEYHLQKEAWVEIKAPAWTRAQFNLPDGTTGWLNSNSSIKYYGNFTSDRKIALKGEAFFDVFKDKKRPFIVSTPEINVKVLGTKFNIASYENEKTVEVVLEEGKLLLNEVGMNKSFTMKPNDLIVYNKVQKDFSTEVIQPQKYVSWKEGKLVFRNDPLNVVARRLERWYNIDIEVNVNSGEDIRWRATFLDENLTDVLNLMKRSLPVDYRIQPGYLQSDGSYTRSKVIITPKNK